MRSPLRLPSDLLKNSYHFVKNAIDRRVNADAFIDNDNTEHTVIFSDGMLELRYYPPLDDATFMLDGDAVTPERQHHKTPVLLVPPLGVYHWIYDLMAERSWVRFLNAKGFSVYLVNWGDPGIKDSDLNVDTYVNQWLPKTVDQVKAHSQQEQISLVGYCMGGLIALLYCGAHDYGQIRNIVTIASPIDFHASHFYGKVFKLIKKGTDRFPFLQYVPRAENLHVRGDLLARLFKLTNPLAGVVSYIDLVRHLSDRDYIRAHLSTREWFNNMPDYPGATVQELMLDFGIDNQLASGSMIVGETLCDLTTIHSNVLAFAGESDKLVSIASAEKLMDLVSSEDKTFKVVPGGHAGVFAGGRAQQHTWAITAQWLANRSD